MNQLFYQQFLKGNNDFLSSLFSEEYRILLLIAYKYLQREENAQDAVAWTFHKLIEMSPEKRLTQLPENMQEFHRYLRRMLINYCIDQIKQAKTRNRHNQYLQSLDNTSGDSTNQQVLLNDIQSDMQASLNENEIKVLSLHLEGYKNDEIAKHLGYSYFTIRNVLHNAKNKLRKKYKSER